MTTEILQKEKKEQSCLKEMIQKIYMVKYHLDVVGVVIHKITYDAQ